MSHDQIPERVEQALSALPGQSGGIAIILATSGVPPAIALLSTGDVHIEDGVVRIGIHGSSSVVHRLGGAFTLLIPLGDTAARVEVSNANATRVDPLALIEGSISSIRPTAEPPWALEIRFSPAPPNHPAIADYMDYWAKVKGWLKGDIAEPPEIPGQ